MRGGRGIPHFSWDGYEGWVEEVQTSSNLTYITLAQELCFLVEGALAYLTLGILMGDAAVGVGGGGKGRFGACKSEIKVTR